MTILIVGLALRLAYSLAQDPGSPYKLKGGDSDWYLANGYALIAGPDLGYVGDTPISLARLATPPLYLAFIGVFQVIFSPETAIIVIRILQSLMSAATCYFAYKLAARLTGDERIGLVAAAVLAINPAFILETAQILTETLYIFLVTGGILAYVTAIELTSAGEEFKRASENPAPVAPSPHPPAPSPSGGRGEKPLSLRERGWGEGFQIPFKVSGKLLILAAVLCGLATLTRAVFLLFPLGLALHLLLIARREGRWRSALKPIALLLVVYALVVSTWTVYSLARWNRLVIAGTGFAGNLYIGATGWQGPNAVDASLQNATPNADVQSEQAFADGAASVISSDPFGYVKRRIGELAGAYLQPHSTLVFPGASLKDIALNWLKNDRTLSGLVTLIKGDNFWPKLSLYIFHYLALIGGLLGIIWTLRKGQTRFWTVTLPMLGFILYTTLMHSVLLAIPRYIFPTEVFWWIFASATLLPLIAKFGRHDFQPAK